MLEDHEWNILMNAHQIRSESGPEHAFSYLVDTAARLSLQPPLKMTEDHSLMQRHCWHLIAGYHLFTSVLETSPSPIWHHRLSHFGPPCKSCSILLRTENATYCTECGEPAV